VPSGYEPSNILDNHTSTVTALRFAYEAGEKGQKRLQLVSGGADKQLIWRKMLDSPAEQSESL